MPACDAFVVCCPAYLLCVAGVQVRACRVFGLSPADFSKTRAERTASRREQNSLVKKTLAAAADLWHVTNDIPGTERARRGCPAVRI